MFADTGTHEVRHVRPGALRDLRRDWQSWSLAEKIVMALIPASMLLLLSLVR
jgi:hypothetical protein